MVRAGRNSQRENLDIPPPNITLVVKALNKSIFRKCCVQSSIDRKNQKPHNRINGAHELLILKRFLLSGPY
jgi:hypothetical protein